METTRTLSRPGLSSTALREPWQHTTYDQLGSNFGDKIWERMSFTPDRPQQDLFDLWMMFRYGAWHDEAPVDQ